MHDLKPLDFAYIRDLVRRDSGIVLEPGKEYRVAALLRRVAADAGFGGVAELLAALRRQPLGPLREAVVRAMLVRETSFFRDPRHFDGLRMVVLPGLLAGRRVTRRLRIWSAAAASGQEAYSIALLLREHFPETAGWTIEIFATDIDPDMVERCRAGVYSEHETSRGLPGHLLQKYFTRHARSWRAIPELTNLLQCQCLNLVAVWPDLPPMDLVLMRNVLIYFDRPLRASVLARAARLLAPDGHLVLGATEAPPEQLMGRFEVVNANGMPSFKLRPRAAAVLEATSC